MRPLPSCACPPARRYRDPTLPIHRTEITRFPHAVLEIKLALPDGEAPPEWVRDLMDSGLITEVGGVGWGGGGVGAWLMCGGWEDRVCGVGAGGQAGRDGCAGRAHAALGLALTHVPWLPSASPRHAPLPATTTRPQVHKSSKFIHGTAVLFPDMVQVCVGRGGHPPACSLALMPPTCALVPLGSLAPMCRSFRLPAPSPTPVPGCALLD